MEIVKKEFPHRDEQVDSLWRFLCNKTPVDLIHIFGLPSTGKTAVVKAILNHIEATHIFINCHECSSTRSLFQRILADISSLVKKHDNRKSVHHDDDECRNSEQFVEQLDLLLRISKHHSTIIVVLDNVERVSCYPDDHPLFIFCRLREFCSENVHISLITISDLQWSKLFPRDAIRPGVTPFQVAFDGYSKDQLVDILETMNKQLGDGEDVPWLENNRRQFISTVVDGLYPSCRDIMELQCQLRSVWEDTKLNKLHGLQILRIATRKAKVLFFRKELPLENLSKEAKFLIIASYLASYNPKDADKFLLKNHGKAKVRAHHNVRKKNFLLAGPRLFPLERLLMIYRCIAKTDDQFTDVIGANVTDRLLSQITTFVYDGILQMASASTMLDTPKYRCLADFDMVVTLAQQVGFELKKHLVDFAEMS